jgi:hypothetical protein
MRQYAGDLNVRGGSKHRLEIEETRRTPVGNKKRAHNFDRPACKTETYVVEYCDVFTGYSDTNLPRVRVSATSN